MPCHADQLHPRPACRSGHRGVGEDPALLRPLRLLHRDLPDLCPARRRTRQPARPHLPDQGHAGGRQAGERGGHAPHRPLPLLPRLHDDLSVGRRLHASRRPRPRPDRGDLQAAVPRPRRCAGCSPRSCPTRRASGLAIAAACFGKPLRRTDRRIPGLERARARCSAWRRRACRRSPPPTARASSPPQGARQGAGRAAQRAAPSRCSIPASTTRRSACSTGSGVEVVLAEGRGLLRRARPPHGPRAPRATLRRGANIDAWTREIDGEGLDAIVITTSGCGTTIKDYGFMFAQRSGLRREGARACRRSPRTSPSIWKRSTSARRRRRRGSTVAYHSACSLQHGQQVEDGAEGASRARRVRGPRGRRRAISAAARPAPTTCCSRRSRVRLRDRKVAQHRGDRRRARRRRQYRLHHPDRAAAPTCPVVHTVELLDWAYGGPAPEKLEGRMAMPR